VSTMAGRAESVIPAEADIDRAPGLLDGAMSLDLTPQTCNLRYWLGAVAQGTLRGLVNGGHRAETATPAWMREPGPLRQAGRNAHGRAGGAATIGSAGAVIVIPF
jgi:hypothetical protein